MQLGFVTAILPELSLEEVFAEASKYGYDCVEVMCWPPGKAERRYAGVTHIDVTALDKKKADEIQSLSAKYKVGISGLGYYPNPLDPNEKDAQAAVEHILQVISGCKTLGIRQMTTFVGRDWTKSVDDNHDAERAARRCHVRCVDGLVGRREACAVVPIGKGRCACAD